MTKRGSTKLSKADLEYVKKVVRVFALEIRSKREELGYTQESLAEELDLSADTIKGIELGYNFPSLPTLLRICRVLRLKIRISDK